ncbi:MAG: hypothetical protein K2P88_05235 [Chitinophagaceae bacterium]|jgi:hypothetical protein|uniref:hypothetical protein n=1 Tax=unclassified Paraflavitalea TaxID=2798305 RepID=UPI003D33BAAA|nr:hypothetical protein [Chitinophagaceae bacterium]
MKYQWIFAVLLVVGSSVSAQTTERTGVNSDEPVVQEMQGTSMLLRDWSEGVVRFSSGRITNQFKIKFDCIANKLLLQFNGNSFSTESKVSTFTLYPNSKDKSDSMFFKKNFPATDIANEETFYQVIYANKIMLVKLWAKHIVDEPQIASKVIYRRLTDEPKVYLFYQQKMILLPEPFKEFAWNLPFKNDEIMNYATKEKLKWDKNADYLKLALFIESILQ